MDAKIKAWILLTFTMLFWGMSFVWTRQLLDYFSPITIITLRLVLSSLFLVVFSFGIRRLKTIKRNDIKWFFLLAFFQPFLYFIFEGYGIQATSASFAAIIIATIPLFTPLGAWLVLKERITVMNFIGLFISFGGVALIIFNDKYGIAFSFVGFLILLGAVISAVGYMLVLKKLTGNYNSFTIATWQNVTGIVLFLPFFLSMSLPEFHGLQLSKAIVWPLIALAILASSLAFIFNTYGVRELGTSKASAFTNSVPVFTVIFAFLLLGEPIGWVKVTGMATVIVGLVLAQQSKKA
ncbi:MAG: DMT family transporter [Salinivirgaceae bacterium]